MKTACLTLILALISQCLLADSLPQFPSFTETIPDHYNGPLFELSQNYPKELPKEEKPWEAIDFRKDPEQYLTLLRDYLYAGMQEVDWKAQDNPVRTWYHMPWMHLGRHPRECIRGLTRERDLCVYDLGPFQSLPAQNWAIGLFNAYGGYTIGQVWADPQKPNVYAAQFPVGTVVAKLIFTNASLAQAPLLGGSPSWQANINSTIDKISPKAINCIRLIQIDIAVRDSRAEDTTGWVFGLLVYDKNSPHKDPWKKMMPAGLTWGNDPGITPEDVANGATLKETVFCAKAPEFAKEKLGWAGRLIGPADNHRSSCLSCHSTAQVPLKATMTSQGCDEEKLNWFRNIKSFEAFSPGSTSTDYSLQLAFSIENFYNPQYNNAIDPKAIRQFFDSFK